MLGNDKLNVEDKIKNIPSALGMLLMYVGFYCRKHILDFGFLPWWVVTVVGIRERDPSVLLGGIAVGAYFLRLSWIEVCGHCVMNIGRILRTRPMNYKTHGAVHTVLGLTLPFIFEGDVTVDNLYRVALAVASSIILVKSKDKMDWFSLFSIASNVYALSLAFLHLLCINWYECYRNNHYKIVKGSWNWIVPIFVVLCPLYTHVLDINIFF